MKELLIILAGGAFVYMALGLHARYGVLLYTICVLVSILIGYLVRI
jgi:hypothetical protein